MTFEEWLKQLAVEIGKRFDLDGEEYIELTGEASWREMFDEGLSPSDAAAEEAHAAAQSI